MHVIAATQSAPLSGSLREIDRSEAPPIGSLPLLVRLQQRDGAALDDLVRLYGRGLTRAAYLFLGETHAAEDAVQETLIAAWDSARKVKDANALRSWLYGVLFNRCRKRRWRSLTAQRHESSAGMARERSSVRGEDERDQRLAEVTAALRELDPELRSLIVLRFERDFSVAETAQALGIPEGTVKSRTHTAMEALRRRLGVSE